MNRPHVHETVHPTLKELLLADQPRGHVPISVRGRLRRRPVVPYATTAAEANDPLGATDNCFQRNE
jgi:hypothetical protein